MIPPLLALLPAFPACAQPENLALSGAARSWHGNSVESVPCAFVNDGDPITFWGSNAPTTDPPKDIGIEWDEPQTFSLMRVKFYSEGYVPVANGWRIEARKGDEWRQTEATVEDAESAWWTFRFDRVTTTAVRLVVTAYAEGRPAVNELEVYGEPPDPAYRRPPVLDGAFWAFHYENWAKHFETDAALADEVNAAHAIGLDTIILYTLTGTNGTYSTVMPDTAIPQSPWWAARDPLEAILTRADALDMRVYLGDITPSGYMHEVPTPEAEAASRALLAEYRRQMLDRYGSHESLVGYYINFECLPDDYDNDPTVPAAQSEELAAYIKGLDAELRVVQPIGLYNWRDAKDTGWRKASPTELRSFWEPYIAATPSVDAFMVIDGVGTGLSPLTFTDAAQGCLRELCDAAGKEMWTDVECAEMGRRYASMPIGRLVPSIEVAATHADHIVTFCYFNYMSPNNGREGSKRLYEEYSEYLANPM